jgi:type VI secretion system protein
MDLILNVLSYKGQIFDEIGPVTIDMQGGSIGRSDDNTLVLVDPDKSLSRHHVDITYGGGFYYLTDISQAGVLINQSQVLKNTAQIIKDGDRLTICDYEIGVSISSDQIVDPIVEINGSSDPFVNVDIWTQSVGGSPSVVNEGLFSGTSNTDELKGKNDKELDFSVESFSGAVINEPFPNTNISVAGTESSAMDDLDKIAEKLRLELDGLFSVVQADVPRIDNVVEPQKEEVKTLLKPVATATTVNIFDAFLKGVGILGQVHVDLEHQENTLNLIGQIFRKLVDGTVTLLRTRAEFKSLFRVSGLTVIQGKDNNPFKFLLTDDVLKLLLSKNQQGYQAATVAIEESTNNLMEHQLALQAGIQASIENLLTTFDPKRIEKQFEQGLVLQKKSKCWDKYESSYQNKVDYVIENIYGDAFVKAYEEQIKLLKRQRK